LGAFFFLKKNFGKRGNAGKKNNNNWGGKRGGGPGQRGGVPTKQKSLVGQKQVPKSPNPPTPRNLFGVFFFFENVGKKKKIWPKREMGKAPVNGKTTTRQGLHPTGKKENNQKLWSVVGPFKPGNKKKKAKKKKKQNKPKNEVGGGAEPKKTKKWGVPPRKTQRTTKKIQKNPPKWGERPKIEVDQKTLKKKRAGLWTPPPNRRIGKKTLGFFFFWFFFVGVFFHRYNGQITRGAL